MPNLKEIRNRITSIGSTMQITSAMKMVSAAKLKKAQDAITMMRPYSQKMQELLQNISSTIPVEKMGNYTINGNSNKILIIVVSSNRGLCGGFNSSLIKEINQFTKQNSDKEFEILTIGKKAGDLLTKSYKSFANHNSLWEKLSFIKTSEIVEFIIENYLQNKFHSVYVVYNHFKNAATQEVKTELMLPITIPEATNNSQVDYLFEPNKEEILFDLIPKTLKTQLYKALLDSQASEHGSRMTAMHKATDNANSLKNDLTLTYNKARQAAITKEILEIVGGAEALNS